MFNGFISNSNDDYHSGAGISSSGLKLFGVSPLHFWDAYVNPEREKKSPTAAMAFGTLVHTMALEPEQINARYVVIPEGLDRRSKDGKKIFLEVEESGKTPIPEAVFNEAKKCSDAMLLTSIGKMLFREIDGHCEKSLYWHDKTLGVLCKARPDKFIEPCAMFPKGLIIDLKTAADASEQAFTRSAFDLEYHLSAQWYKNGFCEVFNVTEQPDFVWAVVEKNRPYAVAFYGMSENQIIHANAIIERRLQEYADCMNTGVWPGYDTEIKTLELPAWAMKQLDNNEEMEVNYV